MIQAISTGMEDELVSLMPPDEQAVTRAKIRVIGNGVEDELLDTPALAERVPNRVLAWGRIAPEKGFEYLIQALDNLPEAELLLFGRVDDTERRRGDYRNWLQALADRNPRIRLDFRTDGIRGEERIALIDSAAVVVVPSLYEPFGVVMLEAFARGKPVVTTLTAGAIDIMKTGATGLQSLGHLVGPPDGKPDSLELAAAIRGLLDHPGLAAALGETARKRAGEFRWHGIVGKIIAAISDSSGEPCPSL